jgi:hypothetical protein
MRAQRGTSRESNRGIVTVELIALAVGAAAFVVLLRALILPAVCAEGRVRCGSVATSQAPPPSS